MTRIWSLDFRAIFKVFGLDAAAGAAAAAAGTILDSGLAPPLTPRDGICRKGKPLAPITSCTVGPIIGAWGFPLRLILSLGAMGGGLVRFQNCSCGGAAATGGGGGVRPNYLKHSQKVQTQKPRHWALENRLGAVQHASLHGISPRSFLASEFVYGKSTTKLKSTKCEKIYIKD